MTFLASPVSSSSTPLTVWTTTFTLWMAATLSLARWWLLATTPAKKSTNPILRAKVTRSMEGTLLCLMVIRVHPRRIWHTRDEQVKGNEQTWLAVSTCLLDWRKMSFKKTTQKGNRWLTCSLDNCRRKNVSCPRCCWSPHSAERVLSSDCYHNKHCAHISAYTLHLPYQPRVTWPMGSEILRSRRSLAVVAGMKKTNDHAEPTKVER